MWSSNDVLPWSTWPIIVTTGARVISSPECPRSDNTASSNAFSLTSTTSRPISSATSAAVSWSITWLMVAIAPILNIAFTTSAPLIDILFANSATEIVSPMRTSCILVSAGLVKPCFKLCGAANVCLPLALRPPLALRSCWLFFFLRRRRPLPSSAESILSSASCAYLEEVKCTTSFSFALRSASSAFQRASFSSASFLAASAAALASSSAFALASASCCKRNFLASSLSEGLTGALTSSIFFAFATAAAFALASASSFAFAFASRSASSLAAAAALA